MGETDCGYGVCEGCGCSFGPLDTRVFVNKILFCEVCADSRPIERRQRVTEAEARISALEAERDELKVWVSDLADLNVRNEAALDEMRDKRKVEHREAIAQVKDLHLVTLERADLRARLEAAREAWGNLQMNGSFASYGGWTELAAALSPVSRENADIPGKVLAVVDGYSANTGQNRSWVDEFTIGEIGDGDYPDIPVTVTVTERKEK